MSDSIDEYQITITRTFTKNEVKTELEPFKKMNVDINKLSSSSDPLHQANNTETSKLTISRIVHKSDHESTKFQTTNQPSLLKVQCDRCGGADHQSEKCPYYSKQRDPPPGYNRDGTKTEWLKNHERKKQQKKTTKLLRAIFFLGSCALLGGNMVVASETTTRIRELMANDEYITCINANSALLPDIKEPSVAEMRYIAIVLIIFWITFFCKACLLYGLEKLWECILIVGFVMLLLIFGAFGIIVHFYIYFDELSDNIDCVKNVKGYDKMSGFLISTFIMQWCFIVCIVFASIFHLCNKKTDLWKVTW